jgi:hypothetical protein
VTITVKDASGDVIRTYREAVHQGINRITWNMQRDGARDMPGPEEQDYEDGLPAGPEVPPGRYSMTLALDHPDSQATVASVDVQTVADPRSPYSLAEIEQNYAMQRELLTLEKALVSAVEGIVRARQDIGTITTLIEARPAADEDAILLALTEQAGELNESLDELEKRFRTPPETKGIIYSSDKAASRLGLAQMYVGSTYGAPSAAAKTYVQIARNSVDETLSALNDFISSDLEDFRKAVDEAGIALLTGMQPVSVTD